MTSKRSSYMGAPIIEGALLMGDGTRFELDGKAGRPLAADVVHHLQWDLIAGEAYNASVTFVDVYGVLENLYFHSYGGKGALSFKVYWSEDPENATYVYGVVWDIHYDISPEAVFLTMDFSGDFSTHEAAKSDMDVTADFSAGGEKSTMRPHEIFQAFAKHYGWVTETADGSTVYADPSAKPVTKPLHYSAQTVGNERRVTPSEYMASLTAPHDNMFVTGDGKPYVYMSTPNRDGTGVVHHFHPRDWTSKFGFGAIPQVSEYQYHGIEGDVIDARIDSQWLSLAYYAGASSQVTSVMSEVGGRLSTQARGYPKGIVPAAGAGKYTPSGVPETSLPITARDKTDHDAKAAAKLRDLRDAEFSIDITVVGDPTLRGWDVFKYTHYLPDGVTEHFVSGLYQAMSVMNSVDTAGWATVISGVRLGLPKNDGATSEVDKDAKVRATTVAPPANQQVRKSQ